MTTTHRMPDQVPGRLRRFDDPYGVTWRVANIFRRFDAGWLMRFTAGLFRGEEVRRPIFIVGMPRSGTTFLFYLLRESSRLASLPREGHDVWRLFHHPRYFGWTSDVVGPGQVRWGEQRVVNAVLHAFAGNNRLVEKTADNVVRVPYLLEMFPDATFVVLKRYPCDVVNSYINGWRHPEGRFRSYYVPEELSIPGYPHRRRWCSTLIDDWRSYRTAPIPEIAFAQWSQYVRSIVQARTLVPPEQWVEVHFEDMLREPAETSGWLFDTLAIENEPALEVALSRLKTNPVNALTPHADAKWRQQNPSEILSLLPRLAALSRGIGYVLDERTGDYEIIRS